MEIITTSHSSIESGGHNLEKFANKEPFCLSFLTDPYCFRKPHPTLAAALLSQAPTIFTAILAQTEARLGLFSPCPAQTSMAWTYQSPRKNTSARRHFRFQFFDISPLDGNGDLICISFTLIWQIYSAAARALLERGKLRSKKEME